MKKKTLLIILLSLIFFTGCTKKESEENKQDYSNSLVLYFSVTNNTSRVAKIIGEETNSDLAEIVPKEKYTEKDINYKDNNSRASKEQKDSKSRPEIEYDLDLDKYETIYLGYPIWFETTPKIIYTILDKYDLTNKKIILFCTSGSTDIEKSAKEIKDYNDKLDIISSKRFSSDTTREEINEWLENEKLPKSEPVNLK